MVALQRGTPAARAVVRNADLAVADVMRTDFRSCNASAPIAEVAAAMQTVAMLVPAGHSGPGPDRDRDRAWPGGGPDRARRRPDPCLTAGDLMSAWCC